MGKDVDEIRREFREIGCGKDGPIKPGTVTCDFYAEFMRKAGFTTDRGYQREWAERFANGSMFQHADKEHQMIMLDIMVDGPGGGTARHVTHETMKEWYKKRFG